MVLTDSNHTGAVQWTQSNLEAAAGKQGIPYMDKLETKAMDWNNIEQVKEVATMYPYDLIIGSDLIYSEDRIKPLVTTIATLLMKQPKAKFLYAHTAGRMPEMDNLWEEELVTQNLVWDVIYTIPQWDDRKTIIMEIRQRQTDS